MNNIGENVDKLNNLIYQNQKSYSWIISQFITYFSSLNPANLSYVKKAKLKTLFLEDVNNI